MVGAGLSRLAKVRLTTQTLINMAARSEFFRSYHLPVLSAEQNDSKSEEINVVDESQAENRFVPLHEAEITPVTKAKSRQSKRKASTTSASISTEKKSRKFSWTPESVEALLKYTKELKTKCEFSRVDLEADLQSLYAEMVSLPGREIKFKFNFEFKFNEASYQRTKENMYTKVQ